MILKTVYIEMHNNKTVYITYARLYLHVLLNLSVLSQHCIIPQYNLVVTIHWQCVSMPMNITVMVHSFSLSGRFIDSSANFVFVRGDFV